MAKRAAAANGFTGFPEAGFQFLKELKRNNDRDWFRPRKGDYQALVEEPMRALVFAVAEACRARGLPLYAKEKSPVMRVYRDVRFTQDKSPLKTHVAAELRRSFGDSKGMLYIHLSPEESFAASGVYQPDRPLLQAWRETIVNDPKRFLKMESALTKKGLPFRSQFSLSKLPRGYQHYAEQSFAPALKLTSFVVSQPFARRECMMPDFAKRIIEFALNAKPLMEFAWQVEAAQVKTQRQRMREEDLI